ENLRQSLHSGYRPGWRQVAPDLSTRHRIELRYSSLRKALHARESHRVLSNTAPVHLHHLPIPRLNQRGTTSVVERKRVGSGRGYSPEIHVQLQQSSNQE